MMVPWNPEKKKNQETQNTKTLFTPFEATATHYQLKDCIQENSSCYRQAGSTGLYTDLIDENTMRDFCGIPTKENRICWCPTTLCHFCEGLLDVVPTQLLGKHVWE